MSQSRPSDIQELIRQGEAYIAERREKGLPVAKAEARLADLRAGLAEPKLAPLPARPAPGGLADEIERLIALGLRLSRGEVAAVRCGATGKRCTYCQGVPCLGSNPWEEE